MDSFQRFPPLTDIFTCGQRPQLQGSVKSLCVRYLERFMSTINGRHVLSADHSINWHLISGWTWRTASLAWYNHWGRNQAQVWAFKPNGAEWKKSSAHCSQQHHYDHQESFIIVWNIQLVWTWPWAIEHYQKSVEWKNAQPSIVESTFSLLLAASCLLGPASVHWATNNKYFYIFSPLFQISARFLGQLSVFLGQLHQCRIFVYPLPCQPISSLLTSIRQRPITGLSSSSPFSLPMSGCPLPKSMSGWI